LHGDYFLGENPAVLQGGCAFLCVFLDGFLWCKRGELMVFCGDLGGRFLGSKKCHLLKIFLWIFW